MFSRIIIFLVLFGLWIVFSIHYLAWSWWLGVGGCIFITLLAFNLNLISDEHLSWTFCYRLPRYLIWLTRQIIVSNLDVARIILSPSLSLAPKEFYVSSKRKYGLTKVIYSNSITLTPGTVCVDLDDQGVIVHSLDEKSAQMIESGELEKRLKRLEQ